MLYFSLWNNFWKQWANIALADGDTKSPSLPAPDTINDGLTPEQKYQYLAEYGTHVLCLINVEKGCTYLSRNFESITGLKCDKYLGDKLFGIIHGDHQKRFKEFLTARIPEDKPQHFRCKLRHSDKKWYWYDFLIHSKHGGMRGEYVCILENIHDSILAQNSLQKAKLEAELALRSRSEFLSNMSHELRTPLNAVIGFAQIIESEIFGKINNPQYLEYIKHIQESGYDLLAKIEDLLEISNIDAGRVTLSQEEVYISDIFRHVLETQMHHAMSAQVTLETAPMPANILVFVDRLKLQHILGHLVANAIKFSPQGTTITLNATAARDALQISVRDTGTGMTDAKLNAITRALQEESCWTTVADNNTIGLGLALTREFVALHGGRVDVSSKPADGTTITISLPEACIRRVGNQDSEYLRQAVI